MSEAIDTTLVRSGTWGSLWIDGEQVAECYGCQAKISKTKESVPRCRAMMEDSKLVSTKGTGSIRIYNATSRLIELEGEALDQVYEAFLNLADKKKEPVEDDHGGKEKQKVFEFHVAVVRLVVRLPSGLRGLIIGTKVWKGSRRCKHSEKNQRLRS